MAQREIVSIIIPFYNEAATLRALVYEVKNAPLPTGFEKRIVLVDDGSTDDSGLVADDLAGKFPGLIQLIRHPGNRGKGHAIRAALAQIPDGICLTQDADLEYDPKDYAALLEPFRRPEVNVVYGSRIRSGNARSYWRYYWGGRLLTFFTNFLYGSRISDEATGYKVFRRSIVDALGLKADGFEFCPELTGKLLRAGHKIWEVPVGYAPRSFALGKKIRFADGVIALGTLLRIRLSGNHSG